MFKDNDELWKRAADFHGHVCPGLSIGYRASLYAMELLNLPYSHEEEVVCIAENDACGVDAVQAILGCSAGKGNLLFHIRGKQAFSFYNRLTGESVRLVLKEKPCKMNREETLKYYHSCDNEEMFEVKKTTIELPKEATIFDSYVCECCGELTGANWIRIANGKKVCIDCYESYDRFNV